MRHVNANLWQNRGTKSGEARSVGCLTTQKSGEARASVPQWFRRLCVQPTQVLSLRFAFHMQLT